MEGVRPRRDVLVKPLLFDAVGFDLGETLIEYEGVPLDWQRQYPGAFAAVASVWGGRLTPAQIEAGSAVLRRSNTRLASRRREVDCETVFAELLRALGVTDQDAPSLIGPAVDAFFSVFRRRARAFPDVAASLAALRAAGTPLGVLTDVPYGMPRRLVLEDLSAAGLDSLAAATLTSVEVGLRKPEPGGLRALAAQCGCSPAAMLYVGNEQKDILGAQAAGMAAALVWRDASPAPAWGQDFTLASLGQVVAVALGG
jgi:putative hydrolase of the HAD superfamily